MSYGTRDVVRESGDAPTSIEVEFTGEPWPDLEEVTEAVARSAKYLRQFVSNEIGLGRERSSQCSSGFSAPDSREAPPARATPGDGRLALAVALAARQSLELPGLATVAI